MVVAKDAEQRNTNGYCRRRQIQPPGDAAGSGVSSFG